MPQYALRNKDTGEWYVGNRTYRKWGNKPRVFTKSGLATSMSIEVHGRWRMNWLQENPPPPRPDRLYVQEQYTRYDGIQGWRSVRTTDPIELAKAAAQKAWFTKQRQDYKSYLKEHGGVLNCLPSNYELVEVTIGEE